VILLSLVRCVDRISGRLMVSLGGVSYYLLIRFLLFMACVNSARSWFLFIRLAPMILFFAMNIRVLPSLSSRVIVSSAFCVFASPIVIMSSPRILNADDVIRAKGSCFPVMFFATWRPCICAFA